MVKHVVDFFLLFLLLDMWRSFWRLWQETPRTDFRMIWKKGPFVPYLQFVCAVLGEANTRICLARCLKLPMPLGKCIPCLEHSTGSRCPKPATVEGTSHPRSDHLFRSCAVWRVVSVSSRRVDSALSRDRMERRRPSAGYIQCNTVVQVSLVGFFRPANFLVIKNICVFSF